MRRPRQPPASWSSTGSRRPWSICYDIEFPESVRAAAVRGAELLLVPTALAGGFDAVPQVLVRARALENQLTVAYANHTGAEEGYDFLGGSVVAGPDGTVLAAAGHGAELLFAELGGAVHAVADRAHDADDAVRLPARPPPGRLPVLGHLTRGRGCIG